MYININTVSSLTNFIRDELSDTYKRKATIVPMLFDAGTDANIKSVRLSSPFGLACPDGDHFRTDIPEEVASPTPERADYTDKRREYERFGVGEYWRFDPSGGKQHDAALEGDRLVDGEYKPTGIEDFGEGRFRGYSEARALYVCWEDGMLRFLDPVTENCLRSHAEVATLADADAKTHAQEEAAARETAEARVAELDAESRRLRGE